jgi:hypothetical protein
LRNLHHRFDWHYIGQIYGGDFAKYCGLLRIHNLYAKGVQKLILLHVRSTPDFSLNFGQKMKGNILLNTQISIHF